MLPPAKPEVIFVIPGKFRKTASRHQKQPPPKVAVAALPCKGVGELVEVGSAAMAKGIMTGSIMDSRNSLFMWEMFTLRLENAKTIGRHGQPFPDQEQSYSQDGRRGFFEAIRRKARFQGMLRLCNLGAG